MTKEIELQIQMGEWEKFGMKTTPSISEVNHVREVRASTIFDEIAIERAESEGMLLKDVQPAFLSAGINPKPSS